MIDQSLAEVRRHGTPFNLPEILHARGTVLAMGNNVTEAAASFKEAVKIAGAQGALGWKLRAATSMTRLGLRDRGVPEARPILAGTYAEF